MVGKSSYLLSAMARPMSLGYRRPTGEVVEGRSGCPQRSDICECATAGSLTLFPEPRSPQVLQAAAERVLEKSREVTSEITLCLPPERKLDADCGAGTELIDGKETWEVNMAGNLDGCERGVGDPTSRLQTPRASSRWGW